MKKYKITMSSVTNYDYIIEAENEEHAEELIEDITLYGKLIEDRPISWEMVEISEI